MNHPSMNQPGNAAAPAPQYSLPGTDGMPFQIVGGGTVRIDLVQACQKINAIRAACAERKLSNFEHVEQFSAWVKEATGFELTLSQADALIDACEIEYMRQKKAVRDLLKSLSSTEPPPSNSTDDFV